MVIIKIRNLFGRVPTSLLIVGIFSIGLAFLFFQSLFPIKNASENIFQTIMLYIALFFFGLSGLPIILRKEFIYFHGFIAVLVGLFILLAFWLSILYGIISFFYTKI